MKDYLRSLVRRARGEGDIIRPASQPIFTPSPGWIAPESWINDPASNFAPRSAARAARRHIVTPTTSQPDSRAAARTSGTLPATPEQLYAPAIRSAEALVARASAPPASAMASPPTSELAVARHSSGDPATYPHVPSGQAAAKQVSIAVTESEHTPDMRDAAPLALDASVQGIPALPIGDTAVEGPEPVSVRGTDNEVSSSATLAPKGTRTTYASGAHASGMRTDSTTTDMPEAVALVAHADQGEEYTDVLHAASAARVMVETQPSAESEPADRHDADRADRGRAPLAVVAQARQPAQPRETFGIVRPPGFPDVVTPDDGGIEAAAPTIRISIGRIEVRAVQPPVPVPSRAPAGPRVSLDDYLRHRDRRDGR
jgi:hypothetical protein